MSSAWMRHALALEIQAGPSPGVTASGKPRKGASALSQKAALMVLAWHHHPDYDAVTMSAKQVADCCGISRQAAMRALSALVASGVLVRRGPPNERPSYVLTTTPQVAGPVTPGDASPQATRYPGLHPTVTLGNPSTLPQVTPNVTQGNPIEYRDRGDLGDPPTPHRGGGPHSQAEPEDRDPIMPTAGDRLAAKEYARASAASAAGVATGPGPAPTLSGAERDTPDDIINTIVWYSNASPNTGGASATHKQRARDVILGTSCAEFIAAVQAIAATDGSSWPRPHIVKARIGTDRMSRIAREKSARADSERKKASADQPHWARGKNVFEFGVGL